LIEHRLELSDVCCVAGKSVNAFNPQAEKINSLDALIYHHRYGRLITSKERLEAYAKYGF